MKIRVNPHTVEIVREDTEPINEREIKVSKCEFEFDEAITSEFVKEAYFTLNGDTYKKIIQNDECDYPSEVLAQKGTLEIGVVAFKVENDEEIVRYNPSPDYFESWIGSLKEANNSKPITPTDKEQMEQAIINLQNNKQDTLVSGENIKTLNNESLLGSGNIEIEVDLSDYYTKQEVDNLIPKTLSELQDDESHRLVSDAEKETWNAKIDNSALTNYVKNTDYATSSKGGVIKVDDAVATQIGNTGNLMAQSKTYEQYSLLGGNMIIGKGTLENVIVGKGLTTKAYVDGLVGNISSLIDTINGEVV